MKIYAAVFFLTALGLAETAFAQTSAAPDPLQGLLTEVRELRLALERATSVWPHSQLVLQRVQIQQQHVEAVSRQLEQLRDQMARSASEASALAAQLKNLEGFILPQEKDERQRRGWEESAVRIRTQMEELTLRQQQQQARESQLAASLQAEQARLNELNDRLDALERLLPVPPPSK